MMVASVALVMIVKDEASRIERALRSVRPWVDRMVIADTGSQDNTPALARAWGAEVIHIPWQEDFSAARNAALAHAQADWHLILDADEWISHGGEHVAALRQTPPDFVGAVRVDSSQDTPAPHSTSPDGPHGNASSNSSSWISRVLPGHVRYAGRVHEQPQHHLPVRKLPMHLGHDGYQATALQRKAGRNAGLLHAALEQQPGAPYLWYQLGKDHDVYRRHREALACFDRAETLLGPLRTRAGAAPAWFHDLSVRRLHALKCCQRHQEGMDWAVANLDRWADSPDFFFALGDLLLDLAANEPARAPELVPMIESAWTRCLDIGERPDLEGAVHGRGSHLARHNLDLLHRLVTPMPGLRPVTEN